MPDSTHAVSMALPRWEDVAGYEEKRPEVMRRISSGYPRFVVHPLVAALGRRLGQGQPCLLFPSSSAAAAAAQYVRRSSGEPATLREKENLFAVATTPAGDPALRAFWQHSGLILSSRQAEAVLAGRRPLSAGEDHDIRAALRRQLAALYDCAEDDVFLAPSGMAAQYAALRAVLERTPGQATAQLGFPYVDTLKLQQKLGHEGILLHRLAVVESELEELLRRRPLAACFSEIPGNPLLGSADLRRVSPLLRRHRVPLVADDVVASPLNVDLGPYADLVATSLTKFFVGTGDAMGGALICNPKAPLYGSSRPSWRPGTRSCFGARRRRCSRSRAGNSRSGCAGTTRPGSGWRNACGSIPPWTGCGIPSGSAARPTTRSAGRAAAGGLW